MLGGGGKVLNLIDLADVYMTFFLPETVAGKVALGSEVRIVLDAVPQFAIPARSRLWPVRRSSPQRRSRPPASVRSSCSGSRRALIIALLLNT